MTAAHNSTAPESVKSGFVALLGRPNAGKSTLINAVMGRKVAITSNTPQTTRHRFRAVVDGEGYQLVLVDTPGMHKPKDALGEELNRSASKALEDVDGIAFLVDASKPFGSGDLWVAEAAKASGAPVILVVSKSDLASGTVIEKQLQRAQDVLGCERTVVVSALAGHNVARFVELCCGLLPEGPRWFPEGTGIDQPTEVIVAEFIREKVLVSTFDEVPHAVGVLVEDLSYDRRRNFYHIHAVIYVERDSQKGIIVGKRGSMIKEIGTQARCDLGRFLGADIYLELRVKVRKGWRRDASQIRRFGYGEGA
ncbi:MAG: GTPase Era [Coriobacteriales bacterium]|jgi:GTP-binding protein Era|nr:GTPase Era [Coriobacteriales bacterium]